MRTGIELFLYFLGIPALVILAIQAPDYIEHWLSAEDRAEQKELYPIIGDQDIIRIATKHIGGNVVCLDPYNDQKVKSKAEQVWVQTNLVDGEQHLRRDVFLMTGNGFDPFGNSFTAEKAPEDCRLENLEWSDRIEIGARFAADAICTRKAPLQALLRETLKGDFTIKTYDEELPDSVVIEQRYTVPCEIEIEVVNNCLPRTYGSYIGPILGHESDFGAFTEYNYCDNPDNTEFKRQVFDKWERSRKLKEASNE